MSDFAWSQNRITPRARVIIDNDFAGDPDGLVQLAHHLLSPSVEIVGVISSHLRPGDGWDKTGNSVAEGVRLAELTADLCNRKVQIVEGSKRALTARDQAQPSAGLNLLLREARRESNLPLYFACGGSLTQLASALLTDPEAMAKVTVVWIGGPEHGEIPSPPGAPTLEYNTAEDVIAAQVAFATQGFKLWQIPRNAYRETLVSQAELERRLKPAGKLGAWLYEQVAQVHTWHVESENYNIGETYVMGDSPLVLLTALQSSFEADSASSSYDLVSKPNMDEGGRYLANPAGDIIRVYKNLDCRMMFEDFYAKVERTASA